MRGVLARAPNRIDLAGGTLDIHPLTRILPGGLTINLAISIHSEAEITEKTGSSTVTSEDIGRTVEIEDLATVEPEADFQLIVEAARVLSPSRPLSIRTHNRAPRGSGLGASSALTICLIGGIAHLLRRPRTMAQLIDLGAAVEIRVLGVPTGTQDHFAAVFGGGQALHFLPEGVKAERLPVPQDFVDALEETIILSDTGAPHDSGATNWGVVRSAIDGRTRTRDGLEKIRKIAVDMREAFIVRDIRRIGRLVAADGAERRKLSRGVVPKGLEGLIREVRRAGALGSRLSGAGGGGTLITVVSPSKKADVLGVLRDGNLTPFEWGVSTEGLRISPTGT